MTAAGYVDIGDGTFEKQREEWVSQGADFVVDNVEPLALTNADRANNVEWQGHVELSFLERWRPIGGEWEQWKDRDASVIVRKISGRWERDALGGFPYDWYAADTPLGIDAICVVDNPFRR